MALIIIYMPDMLDTTNMKLHQLKNPLWGCLVIIAIRAVPTTLVVTARVAEQAVTVAMARLTAVLDVSPTVMQQLSVVNLP